MDPDGSVPQSSHRAFSQDLSFRNAKGPWIGIVWSVYYCDNPKSSCVAFLNDQVSTFEEYAINQRGPRAEASVLILRDDGGEPFTPVEHVVILPNGASGIDNYDEELPHPCSQSVLGQAMPGSENGAELGDLDPYSLDGDLCVIDFCGGLTQPMLMKWYPHPYNVVDSASGGKQVDEVTGQSIHSGQIRALDQVGLSRGARPSRKFKRFQGTTFVLTDEGSLFINTNEANAKVTFVDGKVVRIPRLPGGDIQIDMKATSRIERNWNPPVPLPASQPCLPQQNPPDVPTDGVRAELATIVRETADKKYVSSPEIEFIAALSALLKSSVSTTVEGGVDVTVKAGLSTTVDSPDIALGSGTASELAVLGTSFAAAMNTFLGGLATYVAALGEAHAPLKPAGTTFLPFIANMQAALVTSLSGKVRLE